jgi:hypothetical protein
VLGNPARLLRNGISGFFRPWRRALEDVILIFLAAVSLEASRRAPRAASHAVYGHGQVPHVGRSVEASHKMYVWLEG